MALERQEGGGIVRSYIILLHCSPLWSLLRPAVFVKFCPQQVFGRFSPYKRIVNTGVPSLYRKGIG